MCSVFVLIMSVVVFECSNDGKEKKYGVVICVSCSNGDIYEFPSENMKSILKFHMMEYRAHLGCAVSA